MIKRIGIVAKIGLEAAASHLSELAAWLDARGIEAVFETGTAALSDACSQRPALPKDELAAAVDLVLVLGGDGTLLSMAERIGRCEADVPLLGVNFGHLGFLTEMTYADLYGTLQTLLDGTAEVDSRAVLCCTVRRDARVIAERIVLNDVVITRGALSRMIEISIWVSGQFVATFHADGVIVSTPTGSTAYNLSAGGPIVHPHVDAIVLTPIAPHTLTNRPVVIPATAAVDLQPLLGGVHQQAFLLLDGQSGFALDARDAVTVVRGPRPIRIVRAPQRSYFDVLRQKLRWAER